MKTGDPVLLETANTAMGARKSKGQPNSHLCSNAEGGKERVVSKSDASAASREEGTPFEGAMALVEGGSWTHEGAYLREG